MVDSQVRAVFAVNRSPTFRQPWSGHLAAGVLALTIVGDHVPCGVESSRSS